ncbi:MAG: hypothetical protein K8T26_18575 [Lentisphaerae bacterium]|nr:hypothetical protein [Lentisphaerota bacterium]
MSRLLRSTSTWFWGAGGLLLAVHMAQSVGIRAGALNAGPSGWWRLVVFGIVAGGAYFLASIHARQLRLARGGLLMLAGLGLVLRASMCQTPPVRECDVNRFLWDGAVTAHRLNPYDYAPATVKKIAGNPEPTLRLLGLLGAESGGVLQRIDQPWMTSWHPPLAQVVFAGTYLLRPWSPIAWRSVLCLFDLATLLLLATLVRRLRVTPALLAIYWWNPLLIFETYRVGHVALLPLPLVIGAVLLSLRGRVLYAGLLLALAAGFAPWPLALLPLVACPLRRQPRALVTVLAASLSLASMLWMPLLARGWGPASGLSHLLTRPPLPGSCFTLLHGAVLALSPASAAGAGAWTAAGVLALALLVLLALGLAWRSADDAILLGDRALLAVAGWFLLSPWPYPWQALALVPLLVLSPRPSLLLLTPLLFVHNLQPVCQQAGRAPLFDHGLAWLQSVPVLLFLLWEWRESYWRRGWWRPAPVADMSHWEQGADYRWRSARKSPRRPPKQRREGRQPAAPE